MLDFYRAGGFNMYPLTIIGLVMVTVAIRFAMAPSEPRLAILRALTMVEVFCTLIGIAAGLASTARFASADPDASRNPFPVLLQGFAETMTNPLLGFGLILITWTFVAIGHVARNRP